MKCGVLVLMFGECYEQTKKEGRQQEKYVPADVYSLTCSVPVPVLVRPYCLTFAVRKREEGAGKSHIKYETACLQKVRGRGQQNMKHYYHYHYHHYMAAAISGVISASQSDSFNCGRPADDHHHHTRTLWPPISLLVAS